MQTYDGHMIRLVCEYDIKQALYDKRKTLPLFTIPYPLPAPFCGHFCFLGAASLPVRDRL